MQIEKDEVVAPSADTGAAWRKIAAYCALTALLSLPGYYIGIRGDILRPRLAATVLMWGPGLSAIIVRLVSERSLAGIGFRAPRPIWLLIALALPLAYALPVYLIAWGTGLGAFTLGQWPAVLPYGLHATRAASALGLIATAGLLDKCVRALGEEIGWRGLLVPELLKVASFRNTALISGVIWALWHYPLIIFADYRAAGTPVAFQLGCFAVMIISSSFSTPGSGCAREACGRPCCCTRRTTFWCSRCWIGRLRIGAASSI